MGAMLVIILAMEQHILATLLLVMVIDMVMDIMELESVMLRLSQKPRLMLSMDMVLGTALILWDMAMDILATLPLAMVMDMVLAMALMDMESVLLRLNQRLKLMLSMDMVLDTACILWDMVMDILVMVMDMVLGMALMDMESVLLRLKLMLSMDMVLDTVLDAAFILWDMVMDILVMAMDMVLAMAPMDMESVMLRLNQSPMLSTDPMAGT